MKPIVNIFKALSEEIRIRIMRVLIEARKELCVCEIVDALQEPQYNISRHLNILKNAGLVTNRREGIWILYSLASNRDRFNQKLLEMIKSITLENAQDLVRLKKRLRMRVGGKCIIGYNYKKVMLKRR